MQTLVTGATGFLGRHLVRFLVDAGHRVRALARHAERASVLPGGVEVRVGDLAVESSLRGLADGVETVFHLGAATSGGWDLHREATVEGTRRMLRLSAEAGVGRFVHVSSIVVYETGDLRPGGTVGADTPIADPSPEIGPYARGKVEAERVVAESCGESGLPFAILRPGLIYGPERFIFPHLGVPAGSWFLAIGGRDVLLPLCSTDSVNDALLRLAGSPAARGRAYALVDENDTTRAGYIRLLNRIAGSRYRILPVPVGPVALLCGGLGLARRVPGLAFLPDTSGSKIRGRFLSLRYDCSSLAEETGWRPPSPLEAALARAVAPGPGAAGGGGE